MTMLFCVFLPGKCLVTLQLGPLEMTYFLQKKGHYVYSTVVSSATAHFEACSATQPWATSQRHALSALPER